MAAYAAPVQYGEWQIVTDTKWGGYRVLGVFDSPSGLVRVQSARQSGDGRNDPWLMSRLRRVAEDLGRTRIVPDGVTAPEYLDGYYTVA